MHGELLVLRGCAPTPLASYLKALAVLRLISSPANHVSGEAADPHARGWWKDEQFHLRTTLGRDGLVRFFLHDYAPSPIIAPWNGGSGYYPKDNKDGFDQLAADDVAPRFENYSSAVQTARNALHGLGLTNKPDGAAKVELVATLRATLSDLALPWIDAVLALSGSQLAYPELLGTGGNDGRLEFTNNYSRRLVSRNGGLFDASTGKPTTGAARLLEGTLFARSIQGLRTDAIGQFAPGSAGGQNATTGFSSKSESNPWDFVLMLEGAAAFAGTATRRHEQTAGSGGATTRSGASFPFTVRAVGAGWGGVETPDENDARAEFWAPLWTNPARYCEIDSVLGEGRAILNGRSARDGLDFARAVATLGVSRGFREFERFGFLMRAGRTYLATPIGRRTVGPSIGARLVAELDAGGWLDRVRRIGRAGDQPSRARRDVKRLEDALFGLTESSSDGLEKTLVAVGDVVAWLALSPSGREAVRTPPPLLSSMWIREADDGSPEFRTAAALASIGLRPKLAGDVAPAQSEMAPPMAAHIAPIDEGRFFHKGRMSQRRAWAAGDTPPTVVWGSGGLVSNLIAVLERRLVEASIRGLADNPKPLGAAIWARLSDVTAFLSGDFDDARCAALLAGLVWTKPGRLRSAPASDGHQPAPFAYAALKPIFTPDDALHEIGVLADKPRMRVPPGIVARLRSGAGSSDGRTIDAAVRRALARARASGLPSPFDPARSASRSTREGTSRIGAGIAPDRLAAALLIPIGNKALSSLIDRAYPRPDDDNLTTENTRHAC